MPERRYIVDDFIEYLRMLNAARADYALIGGHAVAIWAQRYLPENATQAIGVTLPLLSKALDLRAEESVAHALATELRTTLTHAQFKKQPHMGKTRALVVHLHGHSTTIEILQRVPGLDPSADEPPRGHTLRLPLARQPRLPGRFFASPLTTFLQTPHALLTQSAAARRSVLA